MSTHPDDAELVARSQQRDTAAFGTLVDRHHRLVFGVALATCGDPALAEDVVQDAFVAAWTDLHRLRDADRVGSWIAGIARNLAALAARRRARGSAQPDDIIHAPTPEDDALEREDRELLRRALARLPEPHREALVLYYLEGQSIARIANALSVHDDVVKKRLSRGRKALRDSLAQVEAALTRVGPRAAMTATIITAVTGLGSRKAIAAPISIGKVIAAMSPTKLSVAAIATLALVGGATWLGVHRDGDAARRPPETTSPTSARARGAEGTASSAAHVQRITDPARRASLLDQIRRAAELRSRQPPSTTSARAGAGAAASSSTAYEDYVTSAVVEIVPLLEECFKQALDRNRAFAPCKDPPAAGDPDEPAFDKECQFQASITIEGEPGVGGLVTASAIDAASNVNDPEARECFEHTLSSVEIGPPPVAGRFESSFLFKAGVDFQRVPEEPQA